MIGKLHYRTGAESVLCGQDRRNRTPGSKLGVTIVREAVDCQNCLKLMVTQPPATTRLAELSKAFTTSMIVSANRVRKSMGMESLCKVCSEPIRMIVMTGTDFCCINCQQGKPKEKK